MRIALPPQPTGEIMQMKYYVIEINYVGPNDLGDVDTIGIYKTPAYGNLDKRPVIDGWAGTTNDWATYGQGEYDTIEQARAKIDELYPERREVDEYDDYEDNIIELYKPPGEYAEMTRMETSEWLAEDLRLTGDETDEQLREIVEIAESNANDNGCTLHHSAFDILAQERANGESRRHDVDNRNQSDDEILAKIKAERERIATADEKEAARKRDLEKYEEHRAKMKRVMGY